ncbi:MAG TPA: helix-turn-helix transcriptional regulator [Candidatus Merdenecus merdavium]|nr:helix-turn-helix transcriptional regulator [Candidatus Merdenecus merdavium]
MQINDQIKENRKSLGMTQEQVANYLGVTAPAVNKWENGITYPDITLLPALARILKIDLNTLFSFREELTEPEIKSFIINLLNTVKSHGLDAAFEAATEKIHEYPLCNRLIYYVANTLDSALVLSVTSMENKEKYDVQIMSWYELAANSREESIRISVIFILAGKYIKSSEFDKARKLIDKLPEKCIDKSAFQAEIFLHQGKIDEAAALLQGMLVQGLENIQRVLFKLIDIELKADRTKTAKQISEIAENMVYLFGLWKYGAVTPYLQIALYEKDVEESIKQIKTILDVAYEPWNMDMSPLFYRIAQEEFRDMAKYFIPAFISELKSNSEYDFLRTHKRFKILIDDYDKE